MLRLLFFVSMFLSLLAGHADAASSSARSTISGVSVSYVAGTKRELGTALCNACTSCSSSKGGLTLPFNEFPFVAAVGALLILMLVKRNKMKILFWTLGLMLFFGLSISAAKQDSHPNNKDKASQTVLVANKAVIAKANAADTLDEFESVEGKAEFSTKPSNASASVDEFEAFNKTSTAISSKGGLSDGETKNLTRTLIALLATVISGFAFKYWRKKGLRYLFLLSSLVFLGFYSGGCPCMISSFQNFILLLLGEPVQWLSLIWVLALLPITYFFGKVWCGWVCHLGAFQEFLFKNLR